MPDNATAAAEKVEDIARAAGAGSPGEDVRADLEALRRDVRRLMEEAQANAKAKASDLAGEAKVAAGEAREWTEAEAKAAVELVRQKPIASMAIAAGVGALLGMILARR